VGMLKTDMRMASRVMPYMVVAPAGGAVSANVK